MEKIVFNKVTKSYNNGQIAVDDLSLSVQEGETLVLIGTSGCGKTTTLKMINRLIETSKGEIFIDGENILDENPIELRRKIGYVIQSIGLFPHMTTGKNIGVIPELMKWPKEKIATRIDELLSMVGLEPEIYRDRFPAELSGGQQQRIGFARALAADPPIILMDEPFGALDPITREQIQNEFLSLLHRIKKTIVFVTHDIFEAVRIADRIALMDRGKILQMGMSKEIIEKPANQFVVDFLGNHHFHLGLLLIKAKEIMKEIDELKLGQFITEKLPSLASEDTILDALNIFKQHDVSEIPVLGYDRKICGIVTRDDIRKKIIQNV
jgi:osmoprotectant transport system ATP-binding protein